MSTHREKGFKETVRIERALRLLFDNLPVGRLESESLPIAECSGRILAEDLVAHYDIPPFDRAAMDGYAVIAQDTFGASATNPVILRVIGEGKIGAQPQEIVHSGEAFAIPTGGMMPRGADAVVMIEFTRPRPSQVEVTQPVTPGENVSRRGEDVKKGEILLKAGTKLKPMDIGLLAALHSDRVKVVRKPRVAVLSTGDELVDVSAPYSLGKIVDVNRPVMRAMIEEAGGEFIDIGISPDDEGEVKHRLKLGLEKADIVLVSAGTSVGKGDFVPDVINSLGKPGLLAHGIAMRPSMPTGLAVINGKPLISLPGYPASAIFSFLTFVRPLILWMLGTIEDPQPIVRAKMARRVAGNPGLRTFVRVQVRKAESGLVAYPLRSPGAGILSSFTRANGILTIPEDIEGVDEQEEVEIMLFRPIERL